MRCHWIAAGLVLCLLAADAPPRGFTYPKISKGDTDGVLTVTVAEEDVSKPVTVDYLLEIHTDTETKVDLPKLLNDDAWKSTEGDPEFVSAGHKQTVSFHLHLEQTKPGREPLPGVTVHFHKDDVEDELTWTDILREPHELPLPPVTPPPPLNNGWQVWWIIGIVVVLAVVLVVTLRALWGKKVPLPLTPAQRALRDLERIEGLGLAGPDETGWYPEEISSVIRRYLSERYGLPAQQQTTAEFLRTMRQTPELPEELQQTMKELLECCDLAKFAAQRTPPEECRRLAALARSVIHQASQSDANSQ